MLNPGGLLSTILPRQLLPCLLRTSLTQSCRDPPALALPGVPSAPHLLASTLHDAEPPQIVTHLLPLPHQSKPNATPATSLPCPAGSKGLVAHYWRLTFKDLPTAALHLPFLPIAYGLPRNTECLWRKSWVQFVIPSRMTEEPKFTPSDKLIIKHPHRRFPWPPDMLQPWWTHICVYYWLTHPTMPAWIPQ